MDRIQSGTVLRGKVRFNGTSLGVYSDYASNVVTSHSVDQHGNLYVGVQISEGSVIYTPRGPVTASGQRSIVRIMSDGTLNWMNSIVFANVDDIYPAPDGLFYVSGTCFGETFTYHPRATISTANCLCDEIDTAGNFPIYMGKPQTILRTWDLACLRL